MAKQEGKTIANRKVKDSAFTAYFGEPENACKLYASLGDGEVSPINENMPLRDLLYLGRTLEKLLDERMIYRRRLFQIPTP